ncbi:LysR family transcriptional regulator [Roseibium polysiphoniae]|uniref:LysR family transcriptional regulator n=1 Tax=Roseibium polysiphoniae TaxID=2571221 RepID=A0ABR9CD86_9HYPH|nr:LysR family transcriptional regulator [Roseibium polysiphoniae]MBD8877839.1 LysR family transcriptional regulator [Roseibium polysiphoniae]
MSVARGLVLIQERGSVSAAARELAISQPALSKGIAQLEKRLNLTLLRRGTRPLELTEEGSAIALYALKVDQLLGSTLHSLEERRRNRVGVVRVGSSGASATTHILPKALRRFRQAYPDIGVEILEYTDQALLSALRDGLVDCGVMSNPRERDLEVLSIASDELVALLPEHSDLAEAGSVTAKALGKEPFIFTKGGSGPLVDKWFADAGIRPNIVHSILQVTSIASCVRAGLGNSIIAQLAVPENFGGLKVVPLSPTVRRDIVYAREPNGFRSRASEIFWRFCELSAESANPPGD